MTETRFQGQVMSALRRDGWTVDNIESPTSPGIPDIHAIKDGREIWIEVKVTWSFTPWQPRWCAAYLAAGGRDLFIIQYQGRSKYGWMKLRDVAKLKKENLTTIGSLNDFVKGVNYDRIPPAP